MFVAKKVITAVIMPLPALLLLGAFGLLLLYRGRILWLAKLCLTLSILGITLLSFYPISSSLMKPYEQQYAAYDIGQTHANFSAVMILGHAHTNDPNRPLSANLSGEALARLVEGIRIWRSQPDAELIVSGYDGDTGVSHARLMAETAISLGVPRASIQLFEHTKDTASEAQAAKSLLGTKPFVLVSSASHLPRAMKLFTQLSMQPAPAPAYYLSPNSINQPWHYWQPKAKYLYLSERAWHEWLGQMWQALSHPKQPD